MLFLSGSRDTFQKVIDAARQTRALQSIQDELKSEGTPPDDPQWRAIDGLRDRIGLQFSAALKESFDQIVYPSINAALRSTGIDLAFAGNQNGEATIRKTLEGAQKFTAKIDEDSFRVRAEGRLFGSAETKVVLWADFKRAAAVNTNWPLHKTSALDDLKTDCLRRGLWREEGSHVRRGPFPPPQPTVEIRVLSASEDGDGHTFLKVEPLHATQLVYETGDSEPTAASSPVPTPARFEATGLRYRFLAVDPEEPERLGVVKEWSAQLRLKYQLHHRGDHFEVELQALPKANGITIRYTTDGSSPTSVAAATYENIFRVPAGCRVVCAYAYATAYSLASETIRITIPQPGTTDPTLDRTIPARYSQRIRLDDAGTVWDFLQKMESAGNVTAYALSLSAESADELQHIEYTGDIDGGYQATALKSIADSLQILVGAGGLKMTLGSLGFSTGQALLDWLRNAGQSLDMTNVTQ